MDISDVASRSGLTTATLRYYERRGLIKSTGRINGRRQFDDGVLDRLALIALGQAAGFSLDEINGMFGADGEPRIDRDRLAAKAADIDAAIDRLVALRDGLLHASRCSAPSHLQCRTFRRLMRLAANGSLGRPPSGLPPRRSSPA